MPAVPTAAGGQRPGQPDDDAGIERQLRRNRIGGADRDGDDRRADQTEPQRGERGQQRGDEDRERGEPAGRARQRVAAQRRPDRVRLDLRSRHEIAAARRRRVEILETRRRRADHDDLAAEDACGHAPAQHLPERDAAEGAGASAVVDECVAARESRPRERLPAGALRGDDGKALEVGDLVRVVRDYPAVRGREVGGRCLRMDLGARLASPPRTLVRPCASLWLVASVAPPAAPMAS